MNSSGTPTLSLGGTREASSSDLQKSLALVTALSPLASQKPSQNMDALLVSSGGTDPRVSSIHINMDSATLTAIAVEKCESAGNSRPHTPNTHNYHRSNTKRNPRDSPRLRRFQHLKAGGGVEKVVESNGDEVKIEVRTELKAREKKAPADGSPEIKGKAVKKEKEKLAEAKLGVENPISAKSDSYFMTYRRSFSMSPKTGRKKKRSLEEELEVIRKATSPKNFIYSRTFLRRLGEQVLDRDVEEHMRDFVSWRTQKHFRWARSFYAILAILLLGCCVAYFATQSPNTAWIYLLLLGGVLPSIVMLILGIFGPKSFMFAWEGTLMGVMVMAEVAICTFLLTTPQCKSNNVGENCHLASMAGLVIFVIPIIFGIGIVKGWVGMTIVYILFTVSAAVSSFEHQLNQVGVIVLGTILYAVLMAVVSREHELFVVHFAFSKRIKEATDETKEAMRIIMNMKDTEANYRKQVAKFELRSVKQSLLSVKEALRLALSHQTDEKVRDEAWGSLLQWMQPSLKANRSRTLQLVRSQSGDLSQAAKEYAKMRRRNAGRKKESAGAGDIKALIDRERNTAISAVKNIQTWFSHLETMQRGLGHHLLTRDLSPGGVPGNNTVHVFLGGSCNPTTWRKDIAIPLFRDAGISYYNPQVEDWTPDLVEVEAQAKAECRCLFFVIDMATRATSSILEAVEYICSGRVVVLVIKKIPTGMEIDGSKIVGRELKDLNRGREYLRDVAKRHGVPIFHGVQEAVKFIVDQYRDAFIIRASISKSDIYKLEELNIARSAPAVYGRPAKVTKQQSFPSNIESETKSSESGEKQWLRNHESSSFRGPPMSPSRSAHSMLKKHGSGRFNRSSISPPDFKNLRRRARELQRDGDSPRSEKTVNTGRITEGSTLTGTSMSRLDGKSNRNMSLTRDQHIAQESRPRVRSVTRGTAANNPSRGLGGSGVWIATNNSTPILASIPSETSEQNQENSSKQGSG